VAAEKPATRPVSWPWLRRHAKRRRPGRPPRLIPRSSRGEALALHAIVLFKTVKSAILFAIGITGFFMIGRDFGAAAARLAEFIHLDVHRHAIEALIARLTALTPRQVGEGAAGATVYACVLAVEAYGLGRRRRWAAWLAAGIGAALLPIEVFELARKPGVRLACAFAVNLAIVVYLSIEARRARPTGPRTRALTAGAGAGGSPRAAPRR
jgi:uncharacterized membrane protein (DUF2068 family)